PLPHLRLTGSGGRGRWRPIPWPPSWSVGDLLGLLAELLRQSLFAEAVADGVRGDALHDELSHGHADTRDDSPGQGLGHRDLVIDGVRRRRTLRRLLPCEGQGLASDECGCDGRSYADDLPSELSHARVLSCEAGSRGDAAPGETCSDAVNTNAGRGESGPAAQRQGRSSYAAVRTSSDAVVRWRGRPRRAHLILSGDVRAGAAG